MIHYFSYKPFGLSQKFCGYCCTFFMSILIWSRLNLHKITETQSKSMLKPSIIRVFWRRSISIMMTSIGRVSPQKKSCINNFSNYLILFYNSRWATKKIWDKSEHPMGSHNLVEILGQNRRKIGPNFIINFDLAITFKPLQFFYSIFMVDLYFSWSFHTPMMTIFRAILSQAIIAKMIKMAIMAVMEWYNMATNMAVIGVYGKSRINADSPWKGN